MKIWKIISVFILLGIFFCNCNNSKQQKPNTNLTKKSDSIVYTNYSELKNQYVGFDSPRAINTLAKIENEYFRNYSNGISKYYGTVWRQYAEINSISSNENSIYNEFVKELGHKGDSMHCTIYADRALKFGLGEFFEKLEKSHRRIWKNREHAGWSVGYILVKEFDWKAYLVLDSKSEEFDHCVKSYNSKKEYPVWKQPNIPLEGLFIRGKDNDQIQKILLENEFGWGFSQQGVHTWVTRFDNLKECNWSGAPGKKYELSSKPLFISTPFLRFYDYSSHVIIFPPKKKKIIITLTNLLII